jgi:hypothetical protein
MRKGRVTVFSTAQLLNEIYLPTKFHVDISYSFRVIYRTNFTKCKNKQRAIIHNLGKAELRFLSTAHLYLLDLSIYKVSCWFFLLFQSYVPDKNSGGTDGRMDKTAILCSPLDSKWKTARIVRRDHCHI